MIKKAKSLKELNPKHGQLMRGVLRGLDRRSRNVLSRIVNLNISACNFNIYRGNNVVRLTRTEDMHDLLRFYTGQIDPDCKIPARRLLVDLIYMIHFPVWPKMGFNSQGNVKKLLDRDGRGHKVLRTIRKLNDILNFGSLVYSVALGLGDNKTDVRVGDCVTLVVKNPTILDLNGNVECKTIDISAGKVDKKEKDTSLSFADLFYNTGVNRTHSELLDPGGIEPSLHEESRVSGAINASTPTSLFTAYNERSIFNMMESIWGKELICTDMLHQGGIFPVACINLLYSASGKCSVSVLVNRNVYTGRMTYYIMKMANLLNTCYISEAMPFDKAEEEFIVLLRELYNVLSGKRPVNKYSGALLDMFSLMSANRHKIKIGKPIDKEKIPPIGIVDLDGNETVAQEQTFVEQMATQMKPVIDGLYGHDTAEDINAKMEQEHFDEYEDFNEPNQ